MTCMTDMDYCNFKMVRVKIVSAQMSGSCMRPNDFTLLCLCLLVCVLYTSRTLLFPATPPFAHFKAISLWRSNDLTWSCITYNYIYTILGQELTLNGIFFSTFSPLTKEICLIQHIVPIDDYTVSQAGGEKNLPCWKQVKWKKQPVIIHLMAFIVIILIAFIWILFQMLAGTETRPPQKNPRCVVLLWVMFLLWLNVWQLLLSISFQRPVWVHWH